jgi:hypothetical protein
VPPEALGEVPGKPRALQDQRGPHPQGGCELAHPGVEVERQRREDAVFCGVLQVGRDDLGPDHDVALARGHAFGHPRGAGGVQDRREVRLGDAPLDRRRVAVLEHPREVHQAPGDLVARPLALVESRLLDGAGLQVCEPRGVPDHDAHVAVLGQVRDLRRLEQGVYVHVGGADPGGGEHRHYRLPGLLQVDADAVALLDPRLDEGGAKDFARALQVFVGVLGAAVYDRDLRGVALHGVAQQVV